MALSEKWFTRMSTVVSEWSGRPISFFIVTLVIVGWAASGPYFDYSSGWQTVAGTGTAVIYFVMVFLLQNTQIRETRAIQTKLDELILTSRAENTFIGIEQLHDDDLKQMKDLVSRAASGDDAAREEMLRRISDHVDHAMRNDPAKDHGGGTAQQANGS